jgi:hypothetical protein
MSAQPASLLTPRPVSWLCPGRLALAQMTLFDGDPGIGKSWVALDFCARLSKGEGWPDGSPATGPANSLVYSAEDNDAETVVPRLQALGADLGRVFVWPSHLPGPLLPGELPKLEEEITRTEAKLVVLDPLAAFLEAGAAQTNQQVRALLAKLGQLARARGCAILLIRHLAKHAAGGALYRGLGAIAFMGMCRLAWFAARDPRERSRCVVASAKNNLGVEPPALAYRVQAAPSGAGSFEWRGVSPWTADALARRRMAALDVRRARARQFLEAFLRKRGPTLTRDLKRAAQRHNISEGSLQRARKDVKVKVDRVPINGRVLCVCRLEDQQLPPHLRPPQRHDLDPWLEKLTAERQ